MLAFFGALPVVGNIVTALTGAWFNAKVRITAAKIGGDRERAKQIVSLATSEGAQHTERLRIIAGSRILMTIVVAFAIVVFTYYAKCVVWDKVLAWGTTDPLTGQVGDWSNQIIWFIFGSPTAISITRMLLSRRIGE